MCHLLTEHTKSKALKTCGGQWGSPSRGTRAGYFASDRHKPEQILFRALHGALILNTIQLILGVRIWGLGILRVDTASSTVLATETPSCKVTKVIEECLPTLRYNELGASQHPGTLGRDHWFSSFDSSAQPAQATHRRS